MEERRRNMIDLSEVKSDIKILLQNQAEIKTQVKLTNGRVSRLEIWKAFIGGGLGVILVLIIPIVLQIVYQWIRTNG